MVKTPKEQLDDALWLKSHWAQLEQPYRTLFIAPFAVFIFVLWLAVVFSEGWAD